MATDLSDLQERLDSANRRLSDVRARYRLARDMKAEAEKELLGLGFDPDSAEAEIANLEHRIEKETAALESELLAVEEALDGIEDAD